jgi:hypothetical protein
MSDVERFAICIQNGDYASALELRKVYEVLEDAAADSHDMVRVIDESGEDYLYPRMWFVRVTVPAAAEEVLHELATK